MIVFARLLSRLVGIALLALLAILGVLAAVFCISGGHGSLSLSNLAAQLHLPALRGDVDFFLARITASGPTAVIALLAGIGGVLLGLILLIGVWVRPRPRRLVLGQTGLGSLDALGRPLRQMLTDHATQPSEVRKAAARVRAHPRRDGGRARVRVRAAAGVQRRAARQTAQAAVSPVADTLLLRIRFRARAATRHQRRAARA